MNTLIRISTTMIMLLLAWQGLIFFFHLPAYILPTPIETGLSAQTHFILLAQESIPTLIETLAGLLLGIFFGCIAALCIIFLKPMRYWFLPLLITTQAIPTFAIAPLLVIWFGYGITSKIIATVLMIFFPITSSFIDGLNSTPSEWVLLGKSLHAKKWGYFWHIQLPAALPHLATGIRIATIAAPIGAIIGEWVGASHGLGFLMLNANARLQIDLMFDALILIIGISLTLYFIVDQLLKKWIWWK